MIDERWRLIGRAEELVGDIANHGRGRLVLNRFEFRPCLLKPLGQQRDYSRKTEIMIVGVEPHRAGREAEAFDIRQLDCLGTARLADRVDGLLAGTRRTRHRPVEQMRRSVVSSAAPRSTKPDVASVQRVDLAAARR